MFEWYWRGRLNINFKDLGLFCEVTQEWKSKAQDFGRTVSALPESYEESLAKERVALFSADIMRAHATLEGVELRGELRWVQSRMRAAQVGPADFWAPVRELYSKGLRMMC